MAQVTIVNKLGHGAFGDVYLVQMGNDHYALKVADVSRLQKCRGPDFDVESEAKLLQRLCHPHLVQCCGYFLQGTFLYIVTEFCQCGNLQQYLQKRKHYVSEKKILLWTGQLADALRYLHASKIIHRDVKTENIFFDVNQNIKLGDLGVARELQHTEEPVMSNVGTRNYMSPEVIFGANYTTKTDIWSLGCCVHEAMSLRPTFQTKSMWEQMERMKKGRVPPVPDIYSQQLKELLLLMLDRNPDTRPDALEILLTVSQINGLPYKPGPLEVIKEVDLDPNSVISKVHEFQVKAEFSGPYKSSKSMETSTTEVQSIAPSEPEVKSVPRPLPQPKSFSPPSLTLPAEEDSQKKSDDHVKDRTSASTANEPSKPSSKNSTKDEEGSESSASESETGIEDSIDSMTLTSNMSPRSFLSQSQDMIDPTFMERLAVESQEWLRKRFQHDGDNEVCSRKLAQDPQAELDSECQVTLYTRAQNVKFHKSTDSTISS
ncbi:serine/threonine-protein kinase Nek3 [Aplysia californica]|uniref:non-specific serine/threonine protein kinase n=1 Tax=Aplysia californica TaxID=6500 RepID=A0ABM0K600_APLCA|nr:serine/threonine-protein kinase Nek3 [Aplysia californica]